MKKLIIGSSVLGVFLVAGIAYAMTTTYSPTACTNTGWIGCSSAFSSDNLRSRGGVGTSNVWRGYQFPGPIYTSTATVEVGVEGKQFGGTCQPTTLSVAVSADGGTTYGANHFVSLPCNNDSLTWSDVSADIATISNTLFAVRATCVSGSTCALDHLPVRVTQ